MYSKQWQGVTTVMELSGCLFGWIFVFLLLGNVEFGATLPV